jgi:hypothetical protein
MFFQSGVQTLCESDQRSSVSGFDKNRCFCLDEIEALKGITILVIRLAGCLHTSRIRTNDVMYYDKSTYLIKVLFLFFFF